MNDQRPGRAGGENWIGKYIFAFIAGGSVCTFGLLAVAFMRAHGAVPIGIYDVVALPLVFLVGGVVVVGVTVLLRKRNKK